MLQGVFEHSTINHNNFVDMVLVKRIRPTITRGIYEPFNYPVTIFTIEDPETTFGIMGLYPLVRYFKKFLV